MCEEEKMLRGELYFGYDTVLLKKREKAKDLCFLFNQTKPSQRRKRLKILQQLIGKIGKNVWIESDFYCDYGSQITLGDRLLCQSSLYNIRSCTSGDRKSGFTRS